MELIKISKIIKLTDNQYIVFGEIQVDKVCEADPAIVNGNIPARIESIGLLDPKLSGNKQDFMTNFKRISVAQQKQKVALCLMLPPRGEDYKIDKIEAAYPVMSEMLQQALQTIVFNVD